MKVVLIILAAIFIALQYRLWLANDGLIRVFNLQQEIKKQHLQNEDLKRENSSLVEEINSLKQGGVAIENRARNDLGMVKKGEVFYQVVK